MATPKIRAAIYTRISQDRYADDPARAGAGVTRQRQDCEKLCKARGWPVVEVYTDNDTSAYDGRRRPAYEALLADIEAGRVNAVVVWHLDRLHRRPIELEGFMVLCERRGVTLATVTGDIDLGTDTGRLHARIMGAVARSESERKSVRGARAARQRAEQGRRNGHTRAFGHDGNRVVPAEAKVIRQAARRILAGESLAAVTRDLNDRGVVTIKGGPFTTISLRQLLCTARISGRREYIPTAEYLGKGKARPLIGEIVADVCEWKKIIEPEDSDRLRVLLTDPARRTNHRTASTGGRPHSTLLSGILRCTRCGDHPMYSRPKRGNPCYQCVKIPGKGGCGGMAVVGDRADRQVIAEVFTELAEVGIDGYLTRDDPGSEAADRIRAGEARKADLLAAFADGEMTRPEWRAATARVDARLEPDLAVVARTDTGRALEVFRGCRTVEDFAAAWDRLIAGPGGVGAGRAALLAVLDHVKVYPSARAGHWDPDRIELWWRG